MKISDKPVVSGVRYLDIDENRAGQRLDNFLITALKGVPKSRIYRFVRKGEVRVNRGRVAPDYRLQEGDSVRLPPVRDAVGVAPVRNPDGLAWLNERILYEDDDLIVLDKPAGLAVHGGSNVQLGLIEALRALRTGATMLELVHRLDRETSGCLLVAKRRTVLLALHAMLRTGAVNKRYLALVRGRWRGGPRTVRATLARDRHRPGGGSVAVEDGGKEAESRFRPARAYAGATLMEIDLLTGRTHQARVHAAHLGHVIAGDDKYGDREFNRELRALGLKRLFLHAAGLRFTHPTTRRPVQFEAPLPPDLTQVLNQIHEKPV